MSAHPQPGPGRSSAPASFGMASMVFGALGIFGGVRALLVDARPSSAMVAAAARHPEALAQYAADSRAATLPILVVGLAMSTALVGLGFGQRRYRRWAAPASRQWAAASTVSMLATILTTLFVFVPIHDRFVAAVGADAYPYHFPYVGLVIGVAVKGAVVTWVFLTFRKPEVVAAMDQPPLPPLPVASVVRL